MKIYVIIVTYNGAPWIKGVLDSLRASDTPCTAVVVDNASSDDTVAIVQRDYPEAVLLAQQQNHGFGVGNNIGISLALTQGADYIFLLNQDAFVTPAALGQLAGFLEQQPSYGLVTPLHCRADLQSHDPQTQKGYLQHFARDYLSDACFGLVKPFYDIRGINAAAWMVRSDVFRQVGGFDPLFFMYGEDDDLINRFAYLQQRFALLPASRVVHLRARSARPPVSLPRQLWAMSERARSDLMLDMKNPAGQAGGKLLRLFAAGLLVPLANLLASHDWKTTCAYWLATSRVLLRCPTILRHARICGQRGPHFLDV